MLHVLSQLTQYVLIPYTLGLRWRRRAHICAGGFANRRRTDDSVERSHHLERFPLESNFGPYESLEFEEEFVDGV